MRKLAPFLLAGWCLVPPVQAAEFRGFDWVQNGALRFPDGAFDSADPGLDLLLNRSHSGVLEALAEQPMTRLAEAGALVRLTVIPWRSTPFSVRVSREGAGFTLDFKLAWGFAANPGGVESQDRFGMDADDLLAVLDPLARIKPCEDGVRVQAARGRSVWIVESLNGPYCVRAYAIPGDPAAADLLAALLAPLRGLPVVVRQELETARGVGE